MPLTIKSLNGDTSFLLTFTPPSTPSPPSRRRNTNLTPLTVVIDPWLTGAAQIVHPKVSTSRHTKTPCITSLAELPAAPDVVIISQSKPDHCNEETLKTLPKHYNGVILAPKKAARLIRSWEWFEDTVVQELPRSNLSLHRLHLKGKAELTVANIVQVCDITRLHNAVGITYRPDTKDKDKYTNNVLSVLYSPHGISKQRANAYAQSHLIPEHGAPLTALIHSFDSIHSPYGLITNGLPGGWPIAKALQPRVWVGAHDEEKDTSGVGVKGLWKRKFDVDKVREFVSEEERAAAKKPVIAGGMQIAQLEPGEEISIA